eukprot:4612339-Prymnesium_polylepis.1
MAYGAREGGTRERYAALRCLWHEIYCIHTALQVLQVLSPTSTSTPCSRDPSVRTNFTTPTHSCGDLTLGVSKRFSSPAHRTPLHKLIYASSLHGPIACSTVNDAKLEVELRDPHSECRNFVVVAGHAGPASSSVLPSASCSRARSI